VARAVEIVAYFEPALLTLTVPRFAFPIARRLLRADLREARSRSPTGWLEHMTASPRTLPYLDPRRILAGDLVVDFVWPGVVLGSYELPTYISLSQHILHAAEQLRPLPGNPSQRTYSEPICAGIRGDLVALGTYLGVPKTTMRVLRAMRSQAFTTGWLQDPRFELLARDVWKYWDRAEKSARKTTKR
jgi:hypothetical protein